MYGSIDGVKDNLPKLKQYIKDKNTPGFEDDIDISEQKVQDALDQVSDHINAALSRIYNVPFSSGSVPKVIDGIANDLAAFKLSRLYQTTISAEENHSIMAMRKDAKELLMSIANGSYEMLGVTMKDVMMQLQDLSGESEEYFNMEDESTWQDMI